jgi:hypothetical protein
MTTPHTSFDTRLPEPPTADTLETLPIPASTLDLAVCTLNTPFPYAVLRNKHPLKSPWREARAGAPLIQAIL